MGTPPPVRGLVAESNGIPRDSTPRPTIMNIQDSLPARLLAVLILGGSVQAQTVWYVDDDGVAPGTGTALDPYTSIDDALSRVTTLSGDTLEVLPGTYAGPVDFRGKGVLLRSTTGADQTTIDAGFTGPALRFRFGEQASSVVEGFELRSGTGQSLRPGGETYGGLVFCEMSSPRLIGCVLQDGKATRGGAIASLGGQPVLERCTLRNCEALGFVGAPQVIEGMGGAAFVDGGDLRFIDCDLELSRAGFGGGAAVISGKLTLVDSRVKDNQSDGGIFGQSHGQGGGILVSGTGELLLDGGEVRLNRALGFLAQGGGLALMGGAADLLDVLIDANESGDIVFPGRGGGVWANAATSAVGCTLSGNRADWAGGGVCGHGTWSDCTFVGNTSSQGGGLHALGSDLWVFDSEFDTNGASGTASSDFGGGVFGPARLERCLLHGHVLAGQGGAAHGAILVDCELWNNSLVAPSQGLSALGAAAHSCALLRCRIHGNSVSSAMLGAAAHGGGIYGCDATDCEIWNNTATSSMAPGVPQGSGGGAYGSHLVGCVLHHNTAEECAGAHGGQLENCTVVDNLGVGVADPVFVTNSIVRGNLGSQVTGGLDVSYSNVEGGHPGDGNIDLGEVFWERFGGPDGLQFNHRLVPGSAGIDAGDPASPMDPDGSRIDLGAWPFDGSYCPAALNYCTAKVNSLGCVPGLASAGTPSLGAGIDDFHVHAGNLISGKTGIVFFGTQPQAKPFQGGMLCIQPPLTRSAPMSSGGTPPPDDCSGVLDWHVSTSMLQGAGFQPGDRLLFQVWYRDPASVGHATGLSDALWVRVCP